MAWTLEVLSKTLCTTFLSSYLVSPWLEFKPVHTDCQFNPVTIVYNEMQNLNIFFCQFQHNFANTTERQYLLFTQIQNGKLPVLLSLSQKLAVTLSFCCCPNWPCYLSVPQTRQLSLLPLLVISLTHQISCASSFYKQEQNKHVVLHTTYHNIC